MKKTGLLIIVVVVVVGIALGVGAVRLEILSAGAASPAAGEDASAGHGHSHGDAGHSHDDGHTHDEAPPSQDTMSRFDMATTVAGPDVLEFRTTLTGEVRLNADRVAHVVPQVAGKVREVLKTVGDAVTDGEVVAWLESTTLGQAKISYLSHYAELSCCAVELTRAQEVHDNANQLLEALASSPSLESLRDTEWGGMGKARSDLVAAYAELQYAQATYDRETQLLEKKITSADEFRKSESALKKAEALYEATRDRVAFEVQYQLLEATRAQQVREFQVIGAERSLYVLGLTSADVAALQKLAVAQSASGAPAEACTDPDCVDCAKERAELAEVAATLERENERLAWYPLRAPFDGTVISKHLSLGESVKDGADVFVMADLATVWVDFRIHQKDLATIGAGQAIAVESGADRAEGIIAYVAPTVDEATRTALARVVLPNPEGRFRPGTFVNGVVTVRHTGAPVVVAKAAIQYIDDQPCVFVYDGHAFEKRDVTLGRTDGHRTEIKAGLQPGENVVTKNAFRVKAESEKAKTVSSGHGHVH